MAMADTRALRLTGGPLTLLRVAAGSPRAVREKLGRLGSALSGYANAPLLDARLGRLAALGHVDAIPTRLQLVVGSIDRVTSRMPRAQEPVQFRDAVDEMERAAFSLQAGPEGTPLLLDTRAMRPIRVGFAPRNPVWPRI